MNITAIVKRLFNRNNKEVNEVLPKCFIATDVDTGIPAIHYLSNRGHFTVDGNSVVIAHHTHNDKATSDIVENGEAEAIKHEIVQYYQNHPEGLPKGFEFLKVYSGTFKTPKPLFG